MAGAKPGVHVVQLKPIHVPDTLIKGNKFIKWDDSSTTGTPVTLRVDKNGYILYWRDQNKEMDFLDISLIRDTRQGKFARVPKDSKLRDSLMIGPGDLPLDEKTITIVCGSDMINIEYINFVCGSKEVAKEWADNLLQYSTNLLALNSSSLSFLEKFYTRIRLVVGMDGKIPVKNILKMVASNRDDRRRVEKALEAAGFQAGKNGTIDPNKFCFEQFFNFYRHLVGRTEVDKVFDETGAKKKPYLTVQQFTDFLNKQQRDPRLNEILYPFYTVAQAQEIIDTYETKTGMAQKGHLSQEGFLKFLMSEENNLIPPDKLDLSEDMNQPLSHYFINSSHNTYLTGHQLTGRSSVEIYRQVLLSGCRCIELDCWDGRGTDEEPIITHGFTMCTEILFKDVIEAIAESAFKTSDYPVILSFENHCTPRQQTKMANYCRNIFGEMLLTAPLDEFPLDSNITLPSPQLLWKKILVKNKKKHYHRTQNVQKPSTPSKVVAKTSDAKTKADEEEAGGAGDADAEANSKERTGDESKTIERPLSVSSDGGGDKGESSGKQGGEEEVFVDSESEDSDESEEEDEVPSNIMTEEEKNQRRREKRDKGTAGKEAEAAMEMSLLVNYINPVHFHSFEAAEKRGKSYEISSFVETQATNLLKEYPVEFVNYNKRQLSRIYPRGTRVDSSNFMPQVFWNAGCQLVALNFQTLDLGMQLNLGIFEYNGRSGYVLKPDFMRRSDRHFDPFAESTVDGIVAGTVTVRVISAQFLSDKKVGTYVEVDMYGLPTDTVRKKFKTKTIPANGINPVYDEEPFVFKKVVLPNLATIRIGVYEETGKLIGHRVLPVEGLRPGYRHIPLRNECNQPLLLPTLFVHISVKDYVPDSLADFAEALSNPITVSREKHAAQMAVLVEDFEVDEEIEGARENSDKMQQRQDSIISRRNGNLARVPSGESAGQQQKIIRMPSSFHERQLSKQDSVQSGVSQASSSSGPSSITRMQSSLLGVENGSGESVAKTTKLNDPEILTPTPLSALKQHKSFGKVLSKREKEFESLRRKHDKAQENIAEVHTTQIDKLTNTQVKARTMQEKMHTKSMKKAGKSGDAADMQAVCQAQMVLLNKEQEDKIKELKQSHAQIYVALCKDHFQAELNIFLRHHDALYTALQSLMEINNASHFKRLEDLHDREVCELKKRMDLQSRELMKSLAKKHKDKQELSRIKREAQQKHVQVAVQERQRLKDILEKRKAELQVKLDEVKAEFEREREEIAKKYHEEFHEKCRKITEQFRDQLGPQVTDEEEEEDRPLVTSQKSLDELSSKSSPSKSSSDYSSPVKQPSGKSSPTKIQLDASADMPSSPSSEKGAFQNGSGSKVNSKEELTPM